MKAKIKANALPPNRTSASLAWTVLGCGLIGVWAGVGAIATAVNLGTVQWMERQAQVMFFRLRGEVPPPNNIVVLAMDQESLARGADYLADPQRYPEMAPIQSWPWQRTAYAQVIDRLMQAGARSVSVDVVLADPSVHGSADDEQLRQVVRRYRGRVVLATNYEVFGTPDAGEQAQIVSPNPDFGADPHFFGLINFLRDPDQRVYQLPENLIDQVLRPQGLATGVDSFAAATLRAAQVPHPAIATGDIFFYGPPTTFPRIPFWQVLDPTNWAVHQQAGTFKDKMVLIGPLASDLGNDFIPTPFSETMPGVELHANALATLLQGRRITQAIPQAPLRGMLIFLGVTGSGLLLLLLKKPVTQLMGALGIAIAWGVISYVSFTVGRVILPTTVPVMAIALGGISCLTTGTLSTQLEQRRLRQTLERYVAAPIVNEILTHRSSDFQALLKGRRVKAAVLFCDIRSFTTFSLTVEPEQMVEQLNIYLNAMVDVILDAGGTVDKFIGDAIMAEFGSPFSQGEQVDAMNAIRAALGMRTALLQLQQTWEHQGKTVLFNGIGINFGEAIAGDIGSTRRREYALIGDAVNVASRVEGMTRKFWTDILITQSLYELVEDQIDAIYVGEHSLKGRGTNLVKLYSLVGLKGEDHSHYQVIHDKLRALEGTPTKLSIESVG